MGFWQFATGGGSGGGSGDVVGPASATDNAIARFDGTTGKLIQNSGVTVADGLTGAVVVGSTGATDNAILRADGTGGSTLAASAATLTAAGSLTIPSAETIEFSTDTGFARSAAGVVKVTDGSTGNGNVISENHVLTADGGYKWTDSNTDPGGTVDTQLRRVAGLGVAPYAGNGSTILDLFAARFRTTNDEVIVQANSVGMSSTAQALWSSSGAGGSGDTGLARNAAAVVRVSDGSTGIGKLLNAVLVEANTAGSGTPNAIAATESGTVFTNEGSGAKNYEALPTAAAGYRYTFIVQDADGMRIVANTGDTIRVIDKETAAAGYIESTTIGSVVTLIAINATEWIATSIHGVWTDGTFTYDDTSLTTP